jgi:hypothetical protein
VKSYGPPLKTVILGFTNDIYHWIELRPAKLQFYRTLYNKHQPASYVGVTIGRSVENQNRFSDPTHDVAH